MGFPKDYRENLEWRIRILERCKIDLEFRETIKNLVYTDILFFFNAFVYTLDVRKRPRHNQPFCTWLFQDELILDLQRAINEGTDLPVEKSRDMGASWMVLMVFVWFWLRKEGGTDFLLGSRTEDYVDKRGDMRTLFEKCRYALKKLPVWLLPEGFLWNKHDNFLRLVNPETGATITGESNNTSFSTAGRYAGILFDEFSRWEITDKSAWSCASDASPCRIPISTPAGAFGQYYELVHSEKSNVRTLHWNLHPEKGARAYCRLPKEQVERDFQRIRSPWFDKEEARRTSFEIAENLQINYLGAGRPEFIGKAMDSLKWYLSLEEPASDIYDLQTEEWVGYRDQREFNDNLLVFSKYLPGTDYIIAVDVAEGKNEGDYSTIMVLNRSTMNVDALHHAKTDEVTLAYYVVRIALMYGSPWTAIETVGPGLATFDRVTLLGYTHLFMSSSVDKAKQSTSFRKGWYTSRFNRPLIVASVREYLENKTGLLNYPKIARECITFQKGKDGKPQAKSGCYDDLVMTLGIALEVHQLVPVQRQKPKQRENRYLGEVDFESLKTRIESVEEMCIKTIETNRMQKGENDIG